MAKFEQSRHSHEVHELRMPQGHGMIDQKYGKGNRSPINGSVPSIDHGTEAGMTAGGPGMPGSEYGSGPTGND